MKETNQQKIKKTQLTYPNSLLEKKTLFCKNAMCETYA